MAFNFMRVEALTLVLKKEARFYLKRTQTLSVK